MDDQQLIQLETDIQQLQAQIAQAKAKKLQIQKQKLQAELQAELQALQVQPSQVQLPQVQPPQVQPPQVQPRERLPKQNNIGLLVMYCQSGKTEVVLKDIEEQVNKGVVCILFSDNNRLLTEQTNARASSKKILSASIISSARKKGSSNEFKNFDKDKKLIETPGFRQSKLSCKEAIEDGRVNTIMVCSNSRRWSDVESIVETCTVSGKQVAIFVDEADKTCKSENGKPVKSLNKWHNSLGDNVIKIVLITGTPYNRKVTSKKIKWLGDHFGDRLQLYHLEHPFGEDYRALKDCRHISHSDTETFGNKVEYVESYLEENPPEVGLIDLIPADYTKTSHEEMVNAVLGTYYDAVIIINGEHKEIRFSDDTRSTIKFKVLDNKELCDKLGKWFCEEGKYMRIGITGYLCLSRGVTFSSDKYGFYIDRMIISGEDKVAEAIQLMSRCAGYTYHVPSVVCPNKIWEMVNVDFEVIKTILEKSVTYTDPEDLLISKQDVENINAAAMNKIIGGFTVEHEVLKLEECLQKGMALHGRYKCPRTDHYIASRNLLAHNKRREEATIEDNPTIEYLLHRLSGISGFGIEHCRWEPLRDGNWLRYWKENV